MANSYRVMWVLFLLVQFLCNRAADGSHILANIKEHLESVPATVIDNKYRTGYHFQPRNMWMNGPMYYKGFYHLFYQYNPNHAFWEAPIWAHSVSKDMINWEALEPAISMSKPFDLSGCWSGSTTILPGNRPVILYTGIDTRGYQVQNVAYPKNLSDPYLREWVKPDYNPLITPPEDINVTKFRDPTTAWLGPDRRWRLVIGGLRKHRGMAVLYKSKDFIRWIRAKHPLHSAPDTGMWECPDFYPVSTEGKLGVDTSDYRNGLKHVLKISLDRDRWDYYTIGSYNYTAEKFVPDGMMVDNRTGLRYDYGNYYASKTFFDVATKRRILMGWSNESDSKIDDIVKGWAGILTVPRAIWLDANGRQLVQWPIKELEKLRGALFSVQNKKLQSGGLVEISGISAAQADIEVDFELSNLAKAETFDPLWTDPQKLCEENDSDVKGGVGPFGLLTLASDKREEQTAVFFRIFKATHKYVVLMCHDPSRSSLRPGLYKPTYGGFVDIEIQKNGKISLRSLIDHSVVESFGGEGRTCMTSRIYPTLAVGDSSHLFVFNNGAEDVKILKLDAWEMRKPLMNGE
ncbi:uncharacterized protein A4U43_C10F9000 [Asparagus officinalis]|uniref:Uncharacterized protein n=1 Tax=Asparagus officinalis TaxID=4686 RepID=A0A5P1E4T9_ASPOF|nr:uncharacterized protein A4U43_C10F9000 [Asparagus officinalis]